MGDKIASWTTYAVGTGTAGQDTSVGNPAPSYKVISTSSSNYGYMYKNINLVTDRIVEFDFMATGTDPIIDVAILVNSGGYGQHFRMETRAIVATSGFSWKNNWIPYNWGAPSGGTREIVDTWYKGKIVINDTNMRGWIVATEEPVWTIRSIPNNTYIGIEWSGRIDNIKVRKYSSSEPSYSIGPVQSRDFYLTLSTDSASYSLGDTIDLTLVINRTSAFPQVAKFSLELEDLDGIPDNIIETASFIMPSSFYKNVTLKYTIQNSLFVSSGRYGFRAELIDPNDNSILASDVTYFEISDAMPTKVQDII